MSKADKELDRILYEINGYTHHGWWWKLKTHTRWLFDKLRLRVIELKGSKRTRSFLHHDLRELRYMYYWEKGFADLRYLNEQGKLVVGRFRLDGHYGSIILTETACPVKFAKPTKGPQTFKRADHESSLLLFFGMIRRRRWSITYGQCL